mmetsp:Transcript_33450/g.86769  ORF Transcript_33450/g.86769 Transcript_33450/m.86769 type:complete len:224 (+) Transcript_33450:1170-1841(+)
MVIVLRVAPSFYADLLAVRQDLVQPLICKAVAHLVQDLSLAVLIHQLHVVGQRNVGEFAQVRLFGRGDVHPKFWAVEAPEGVLCRSGILLLCQPGTCRNEIASNVASREAHADCVGVWPVLWAAVHKCAAAGQQLECIPFHREHVLGRPNLPFEPDVSVHDVLGCLYGDDRSTQGLGEAPQRQLHDTQRQQHPHGRRLAATTLLPSALALRGLGGPRRQRHAT